MKCLVTRGDDAGSWRAADEGIARSLEAGLLKNVSLMACGPSIENATFLIDKAEGHADFGLHVCLNSEWDGLRWGPVSDHDKVPSLIDHEEKFWPTPQHLHDNGVVIDECITEVRAQLNKLRDLGFPVCYMDEHMGVGWVGTLAHALRDFALQEGLIFRPQLAAVPPGDSWPERLSMLKEHEPALYVNHPCLEDAVVYKDFVREGVKPGEVEAERMADTEFWTNPETAAWFAAAHVTPTRYSEL